MKSLLSRLFLLLIIGLLAAESNAMEKTLQGPIDKYKFLRTASLLVGAGSLCYLAWKAYSASNASGNININGTQVYYGHAHANVIQRNDFQYAIANGAQIKIINSVGTIKIIACDGDQALLNVEKVGLTQHDVDSIAPVIISSPNNLSIETIAYHSPVNAHINYTLQLPKNKNFILSLTNRSGDVNVFDLNGSVQLETINGSQVLKNIKGNVSCISKAGSISCESIAGACTAKADSGDISLNCIAKKTKIETTQGSIKAYGLLDDSIIKSTDGSIRVSSQGSCIIDATNGSVSLIQNAVSKSIKIHTINGSIKLSVFDLSQAKVTAKTVCGCVKSDFTSTYGQIPVSLSCINGSIKIVRLKEPIILPSLNVQVPSFNQPVVQEECPVQEKEPAAPLSEDTALQSTAPLPAANPEWAENPPPTFVPLPEVNPEWAENPPPSFTPED